MTKRILLLGATGATGKLAMQAALDAGFEVNAAARDPGDIATTAAGVRPVQVDVMSGQGLEDAVRQVDAVVSALGVGNDPGTLVNPPPLYTDGHENVVAAMERAGVNRLVCISALWSRSNDFGPLWFRTGPVMALTRVYSQMRSMERMLAAHPSLRYTAVRAGYLQDDEILSDPAQAHADRPPEGHWLTRRADLATFIVDCTVRDDWVRACPCYVQKFDGRTFERKTRGLRAD
jgi:nucleoside-diphosphate-sugar epimerase